MTGGERCERTDLSAGILSAGGDGSGSTGAVPAAVFPLTAGTYGDSCTPGKPGAVGTAVRRTGCPADLDRPGHGAHSLAGGCHAGRQPGTGLHGILQTAQRLLLLPAVGVDENFWQRCGIRKK